MPLSDLVCWKADELRGAFSQLLVDEDKWSIVFTYLEEKECSLDLVESIRALIVSLVLLLTASWDHRILRRVRTFPLILLIIVHRPPEVEDEHRQHLAQMMVKSSECCLLTAESDIGIKALAIFRPEFEVMAACGRCPLRLYEWILYVRSEAPMDTQEIEGMNGTLQAMAAAAPRMQVPLASDRLQLKKGEPISVAACQQLNDQVMAALGSNEATSRFLPPVAGMAPPEAPAVVCPHRLSVEMVMAARFAAGAFGHRDLHALHGWSFSQREGPAFIMAWTYYATIFCAKGDFVADDSDDSEYKFVLKLPIEICLLADIVKEVPRVASGEIGVGGTLRLFKRTLKWASLRSAGAEKVASRFDLQPKVVKTKTEPAAPPAGGGDAAAGDAPLAGEEEAFDLDGALGAIIEEEGMGELEPHDDEPHDGQYVGDACGEGVDLGEEPSVPPPAPPPVRSPLDDEHSDPDDDLCDAPAVITAGLPAGASDRPRLLNSIHAEVSAASQDLQDAFGRMREQAGIVVQIGMISMVRGAASLELFFVIWTSAIRWKGRKVSLDFRNRIVAMVPAMVPELCYEGDCVLVPDTGHRMHRMGKAHRPPMNSWCLLIKQYFEAFRFAGPQVSKGCIACQHADALHVDGYVKPVPECQQSYLCCGCIRPWHNVCAQNPMCGPYEFRHSSVPTAAGEAFDFVSFVCPVCVLGGRSELERTNWQRVV